MKYSTNLLLIGITLFIFIFAGTNDLPSAVEVIKGDVSGDGYIDGRDALLILQHVEKILSLSRDQIERGDVYPNPGTEGRRIGDGQLTRDDAQTILEETVGLIPQGDLTGDYNQSQPIIDAIEPSAGRVGDRATLMGRNFPSGNNADTEVYVGEVRAEIVSITGSLITFVVPKGASSARIRLNTPGGYAVSYETFSVLDTVAGVLKVDGTLDPQDFYVLSNHDFAEIENTQGTFVLYASKDEMQIYQAATVNDDNPSIYQYFYIPGYSPLDTPIQIDALSTAKAMVFTFPFIATRDETLAAHFFTLMDRIPEITAFAEVIAKRFPQGVDGVNDPEIGAAWESAVEALFNQIGNTPPLKTNRLAAKQLNQSPASYNTPPSIPLSSAPAAVYPTDIVWDKPQVKIYGIDRDYLKIEYREEDHSIVLGLNNGYSPVDWFVTMYKLDPVKYPHGLHTSFLEIQKMGFNDFLHKSSMVVPADLWTAKIDIIYHLTDVSTKFFLDKTGIEGMVEEVLFADKYDSLKLQEKYRTEQDGFYLIHGYSGAFYTPLELERKDFEAIVGIQDGIFKMSWTLSANAMQIGIDVWDLLTGQAKRATRAFFKKGIKNAYRRISQDMARFDPIQSSNLELGIKVVWGVVVEGIKAGITTLPQSYVTSLHEKIENKGKEAYEKAQGKARDAALERLEALNTGNQLLGWLDKISSGGRILERFLGLLGHLINVYEFELSPGPTPLESAIVVVGDPFSPQITSISPLEGPPGIDVVIEGKRFSPIREENEVWFGNRQAEVVAVEGREKLIVRVPARDENFNFYNQYKIKIETPAMMKPALSTHHFTLARIPIITSIDPYRIFPSVPGDDTGPLAGYKATFTIHGFGLQSQKGFMDKVFIDDREITDFYVFTNTLTVTVPESLLPKKYEVYIVSPENNYTTPRFAVEIIGPPQADSLSPTSAKAGEYVTINGEFLGEGALAVEIGDKLSPDVYKASGAELVFRMPTAGEVGDTLPVRVYTPSGTSKTLSITRAAGFGDIPSPLPTGFIISVSSTSSGLNPNGIISIDEATAIGRGEIDPFAVPWDDQNVVYRSHFYEVKKFDDKGNPYYEWKENINEYETIYSGGGPGNELAEYYTINHYLNGQTETVLSKRINLDKDMRDWEEGDWVIGDKGGAQHADTITTSLVSYGLTFHAVNLTLGDQDSITVVGTLQLGGRGVQIKNNSTVNLGEVQCELGDAVTITGLGNTVSGRFVLSGQNGIVIQEGIGNQIQAEIENCGDYGIVIKGGGDNHIAGKLIAKAAAGGIYIENSDLNEIYANIEECGGHGIYLKNAKNNLIRGYGSILNNQGDGVVFEHSRDNYVNGLNLAGNRSGVVMMGSGSYNNRCEFVQIGAVRESPLLNMRLNYMKSHNLHGIHLHSQAHSNSFWRISILGTGEHGILLEDTGTSNNRFGTDVYIGPQHHEGRYELVPGVQWPSRSGGDGIVIRHGASHNKFNYCVVNRYAGNGVVVQDSGSDFNTFENLKIGMCKKMDETDRDLYQNHGWGVVIESEPKNLTFLNCYAGFNLLGGFFVDRNTIPDPLGIHNIVLTNCYAGFLENNDDSRVNNQRAEGLRGGAGYELFGSSNVFISFGKTWGFDYGIWIHGPDSRNNDIWSGSYQNAAQAGIMVEGSTGDRIDNISYRDCENIAIHIKDSQNTELIRTRWDIDTIKNNGTNLRIENCQSILVSDCSFSPKNLGNSVEIIKSQDVSILKGGIDQAGENGIVIAHQSKNIVLNGCTARNCGQNGISAIDSENLTIVGGYSSFNNWAGMRIEKGRNISLHNTKLNSNISHGLHILDEQTLGVAVSGTEITRNYYGVYAVAGTDLAIGKDSIREEDTNYIESNDNAGICLAGEKTQVRVINNYTARNKIGIVLEDTINGVIIQKNQIVDNRGQGIWLKDASRNNAITRNRIINNQNHGILVQGIGTVRNLISMNTISGNGGKGIALDSGGNEMQEAPVIEKVSWLGENIWGRVSAPNGSVVEVYFDSDDEGSYMAGMGKVMYNRFHVAGGYDPTMNLHGIVIAPDGNTSEFGPADIIPERNEILVFTVDQDGNRDIYYLGERNTPPIRLTRHPAADYLPHALSDGSGVLFVSDRAGNPDIWLYRANEGDEIPLISSSAIETDPWLEPGGKTILFVSDTSGKANIYRIPFSSTGTASAVAFENGPVDGGRVRSAGYRHAMRIDAPAGGIVDRISFYIQNQPAPFAWAIHNWINNQPGEKILIEGIATPETTGWFEIDLDNTAVPEQFAVAITILETGKPILGSAVTSIATNGYWFADWVGEWWEATNLMLRVKFLDIPPQRLTDNPGENFHPTTSPNGNEIAFSSNQGGTWDIWVMNADGSDPRKLTDGTGSNTNPAWNPNGESLIFVSDRNGQPDIYQINKDGSGQMRLTQNAGFDGDPAWSQDGKRLLFSSERDAGLEIYSMENGEIQIDRLTLFSGSASQPHAAPLISSLQESRITAHSNDAPVSDTQLELQLTVSPTISKPGDKVEVSINAANSGKLATMLLEAIYDSAVLRLLSAQTNEEILDGSLWAVNPKDTPSDRGWLQWNWVHPYGLVGDSNLMVLTFEIDPGVHEKMTQIDLTIVQAYDLDLQNIEVNYGSAVVAIDVEITAVNNWMIYE